MDMPRIGLAPDGRPAVDWAVRVRRSIVGHLDHSDVHNALSVRREPLLGLVLDELAPPAAAAAAAATRRRAEEATAERGGPCARCADEGLVFFTDQRVFVHDRASHGGYSNAVQWVDPYAPGPCYWERNRRARSRSAAVTTRRWKAAHS